MRLNPLVMVFMVVWIGGLGTVSLAPLIMSSEVKSFEDMTFVPMALLLFAYLMVTAGFKYESIKSKKFLTELFESIN